MPLSDASTWHESRIIVPLGAFISIVILCLLRLLQAVERSLKELRTDYVDLMLLHYPSCFPGLAGCDDSVTAEMNWQASWGALVELYSLKKVRMEGFKWASFITATPYR